MNGDGRLTMTEVVLFAVVIGEEIHGIAFSLVLRILFQEV